MITPETVEEAVISLLKWRKSLPPDQFQEDEFLYLHLYLNDIPHSYGDKTYEIPLPHSLLSESPKLCLIIDDCHQEALTMDEALKKIESENLPVSKVLNLSNLKSDYSSCVAGRELRDSYDMFFAEKSVIPMLIRLLGKKKVLVPLDLKDRDWRAQIEKVCSCALLCLSDWNSSVVRVAQVLLMRKEEIVENVIAACNGIADVVPLKWANIKSLYLNLFGCRSLSIYQTVPISTTIRRIKPETVEQAVRNLLKWRKSKLSDQEDEFLYLDLYLKEIPHPDRPRTHMMVLRHSILSESPKLCLIVDDSHEEEGFTKEEAQKKIKSENLQVSNVLKLSELKSDYLSPKARRELCDSYDVFVADESVISPVAGLLRNKVPVRFDFTDRNWERQIERACCSTLLCLSTETYYEVRVAEVSMEMDEIVENVVYAIHSIAYVVPNHWGNIGSLHLRLVGSHPLPIYQDSD